MTEDPKPSPEAAPVPETVPARSEPAPKASRPAGRGVTMLGAAVGGFVGGLLAIGLAGAAVIVFLPQIKNEILATELMRIEALEQESAETEGRFQALEAGVASAHGDPAQQSAIATRIASIESRLAAGGGALQPTVSVRQIESLEADIARLKADLESLRKAVPSEGLLLGLAERAQETERAVRDATRRRGSAEATLLVVGQLKAALERGDPYRIEWRAAKRLAPDDAMPMLDALDHNADSGIETRAALQAAFPAMTEAVILAGQSRPGGEGGLWSRLRQQITGLVAIRRIDGKGMDRDAVLARAQQAMERGDLAKALAELSALPQAAEQEAARAWTQPAAARLEADRAISELGALIAVETANRQP